MIWIILLAILAAIAATLLFPTWRRVWAFHYYAAKYVLLKVADVIGLRWLAAKVTGRSVQKLTGPVALRRFFEDMGPTFIKLGQIVASSSGMFPDRYVQEFQKCLDRVRPFSFSEVEKTLADELGDRREKLARLDPEPLASASIAQVHTAALADGTEVVVKVQRPGIARLTAADVKVMAIAARVASRVVRDAELANPVGIVADFTATLREELDFRREAENLDRFNGIMKELGHGDVRAPIPRRDLSTSRVLVMERFFGVRVDEAHDIARGVDAEGMLVKGLLAWFQCVLLYGFFHGDVHAGNLMILDDDTIGFLDFGIVGRFDDNQRWLVTDYIVAFATGDYATLGRVIVEMGGVPDGLDMKAFVADLEEAYSPLLKLSFGDLNYGDMIKRIHVVARTHRMILPNEFVLITKQMLYFDRYAKLLAPSLNVFSDPRLFMKLSADVARVRAERAATESAATALAEAV
ncbi:MAG TPA: AarF/UbiB family protein [Kofleriaceae bacterium]|nr:AarF/UbiB family protein [Kofleriaceae bacterium]